METTAPGAPVTFTLLRTPPQLIDTGMFPVASTGTVTSVALPFESVWTGNAPGALTVQVAASAVRAQVRSSRAHAMNVRSAGAAAVGWTTVTSRRFTLF